MARVEAATEERRSFRRGKQACIPLGLAPIYAGLASDGFAYPTYRKCSPTCLQGIAIQRVIEFIIYYYYYYYSVS